MPDLSHLLSVAGSDVIHALADDNRDGIADDVVISEAIASAIREVDAETSRAGVHYDDANALMSDIAATLAVARLYERRRESMPPHWHERAARARATARAIGDGLHPLSAAQTLSTRTPEERQFTPETLRPL